MDRYDLVVHLVIRTAVVRMVLRQRLEMEGQ